MEFEQAYDGAVDWNFPSPQATPTSAAYTPHVCHTPRTALFPSHFHDAFATPQMPSYTPSQAEFADLATAPKAHSAAEMQGGGARYTYMQMDGPRHAHHPLAPPGPAVHQNTAVPSPMQGTSRPQTAVATAPTGPYDDITQIHTPPPTRGSSAKKPQLQHIAFGTPSTIASRRVASPQVAGQQNLNYVAADGPVQHPQLHFSPDVYHFAHFGPPTAPAMPPTQLLWEQSGNLGPFNHQPPMLADPFAPMPSPPVQWTQASQHQNHAPPVSFNRPAMNSFPIQSALQRPASAVQLNHNHMQVMTTASVDPSLVYSSPIRPIPAPSPQPAQSTQRTLQPSAFQAGTKLKAVQSAGKSATERKRTDTTTSIDSNSTHSSSTVSASRPALQRSNTTGNTRPQSMYSLGGPEGLSRRNSALQLPRTASPLKRVGVSNLGSISEDRKPRAPSVVLTVDEFGRARVVRTEVPRESSPTKIMRERYPGLYDSDSSEEESENDKEMPSRSTSFSFTRGQERHQKAAKLDPPIEGIDGLSIPRSSSAASNKVTPSRAAIAAAAQLRKGNSIRRRTPSRNSKRVNSSGATSIDTAPMDTSDHRQSFGIGSDDFNRGLTLSSGTSFELNAHNRRWSMMSMDHQPSTSPTHLPPFTQSQRQVRCQCGHNQERGQMVQCTSCTQYQHASCVGMPRTSAHHTCFLCTKPTTRLQVSSRRR